MTFKKKIPAKLAVILHICIQITDGNLSTVRTGVGNTDISVGFTLQLVKEILSVNPKSVLWM